MSPTSLKFCFARARFDSRGAAALEFALLSPVLCLLLAGTVDFGGALYARFRLEGAVSAAANYALVNNANIDSTNGPTLASTIGAILTTSNTSATTSGTVVINNGPTATLSGGSTTTGGTAANANSCYCPSLVSSTLTWGSATSCGSACAGGGLAGKFVSISATQAYTPLFSSYGLIQNGSVSSSAVVQAQ